MKAFSLVELSIVLVILGLLTGGILSGQSLIRAAELRGVTSEFQHYQAATNTFRDKYMALPGDMNNATKFWGRNEAQCATHAGNDAGAAGTCNGDGNGRLGAIAASNTAEMFQFWHQLSLAGLIEGNYTGISGSGDVYEADIGINVPQSRISNVGWTMFYRDVAHSTEPANFSGNHYRVGGETVQTTSSPFLKPEEMWNIDSKVDDGKPLSGSIVIRAYTDCTTATANTQYSADYNLSNGGVLCSMLIKLN